MVFGKFPGADDAACRPRRGSWDCTARAKSDTYDRLVDIWQTGSMTLFRLSSKSRSQIKVRRLQDAKRAQQLLEWPTVAQRVRKQNNS